MKKVISGSWSLEVKGDTLDSYLPYFGRAFEPVFGETKVLNFDAPIQSYEDSDLSHRLASMLLQSLSAICSLYIRYLFGITPNIYRTSTGHLPNMNRSYSLALSLLHWGYLLVILEIFFRLILNIL